VLREAAGASVHYGCEITAICRASSDSRKTKVTWRQDNGTTGQIDDIDLLIGGDGRYSLVRRIISGEPKVRQTGVAVSRILVADTSGGLIDDYEQWFSGPNRLLAFRVPPGCIYIACAFPIAPDREIPPQLKTSAALRAAYTPYSSPPSAQARWLIERVCTNVDDTHWARMQEHDVLYRAADCGVLYLGDAAHGMVPTLGQGATQAIEDAATAAMLIGQRYSRGERDVHRWLAEIEDLRKGRMQFVMEFSREATDTMLAGADPVAGSRRKNEAPFRDRLKALYDDVGLPLNLG
jgi:salicylate hydroxylase